MKYKIRAIFDDLHDPQSITPVRVEAQQSNADRQYFTRTLAYLASYMTSNDNFLLTAIGYHNYFSDVIGIQAASP